jgi:hypothetical protein
MGTDAMKHQEQPVFACNMLALDRTERAQHTQVLEQLRGAVLARKELPDGYAFQFAPGAQSLALLAEFMAGERLCCPFFAFALRVERNGGPAWLELTGGAGIHDFIRSELDW